MTLYRGVHGLVHVKLGSLIAPAQLAAENRRNTKLLTFHWCAELD